MTLHDSPAEKGVVCLHVEDPCVLEVRPPSLTHASHARLACLRGCEDQSGLRHPPRRAELPHEAELSHHTRAGTEP